MLAFILFLMVLFCTPCYSQTLSESPDQLWEVGDRRWTFEEEQQFGKWVEENITEDFFIRYRIPTDCADAVYAIRWIYARIAHLPASASTRHGKFIGHWSRDWKDLPTDPEWHQDKRFRAALHYLNANAWTGTLPLDTYPVCISSDSITPGALFFVKESHAGIIRRVSLNGSEAHPLQTWESSLPVKIKKLSLRYFFSPRPEADVRSGLVRFRWPVPENGGWKYHPIEEHPFYSEDQYDSGFSKGYPDFVEAVRKRIDPVDYDPRYKLVKVMGTLTGSLRERVPMVLAGYERCQKGGCSEGSGPWEVHNTIGHDGMIVLLMDHLSEIIESTPFDKKRVKGMMEAIPIEISKDRSITFYEVYQNRLWLSPHPEDSIEARWGLKKCEMIHTQTRTVTNSMAFIERTYRKRDPRYADFATRQQQHILQRLREEWSRSGCKEPLPSPKKKAAK